MLPKFRDISNLNNFELFPLCTPAGEGIRIPFEDSLGFTEEEVRVALGMCGVDRDQFDRFRAMYNGYSTGTGRKLYCPYSIVKALNPYRRFLAPSWVEATSMGLMIPALFSRYADWPNIQKRLLDICSRPLSEARFTGSLVKFLPMKMVTQTADSLWTYMYYAGFLSAVPVGNDIAHLVRSRKPDISVEFFIPNEEVLIAWMIFFKEALFQPLTISSFRISMEYLAKGDLAAMVEPLQRAGAGFSYHTQPKSDYETFYHNLLAGLLSNELADGYEVVSCIQLGLGMPDIYARPRPEHHLAYMPITFEVKSALHSAAKTYPERVTLLEKLVQKACDQFITKAYHDSPLFGDAPKIYQIGIAFCGSSCAIRHRTLLRENRRAVNPITAPFSDFVPPHIERPDSENSEQQVTADVVELPSEQVAQEPDRSGRRRRRLLARKR